MAAICVVQHEPWVQQARTPKASEPSVFPYQTHAAIPHSLFPFRLYALGNEGFLPFPPVWITYWNPAAEEWLKRSLQERRMGGKKNPPPPIVPVAKGPLHPLHTALKLAGFHRFVFCEKDYMSPAPNSWNLDFSSSAQQIPLRVKFGFWPERDDRFQRIGGSESVFTQKPNFHSTAKDN